MIGASKSIWGFDPRSVPEPVVWFDASDTSTLTLSGSNVTAWRDKSRSNYSAATLIGTAPTITTINGNNAVSFISNSTLTVSNVVFNTQSRTVFAVVRSDSFMSQEMAVFSIRAPNNADNQFGLEFFLNNSTGTVTLRSYSSGPTYRGVTGNTGVDSRGNTSVFCVLHSAVSTSNTLVSANGTTYSNAGVSLSTSYTLSQARMYLGSSYPTDFTLCEYMLFQREFTVSEFRQMEGYLADKWGTKTSLPINHPYKSIKPHLQNFKPDDISDCELWFDGADYRTMFQNTAGTTPVTAEGQSVARWTDKIRNLSISNTGIVGQTTLAPSTASGGGIFFSNTDPTINNSQQGLGTLLTGASNTDAFLFKMPTKLMTLITVSHPFSNNSLRKVCGLGSSPIGTVAPNFEIGIEIGNGNGGALSFDFIGSAWTQIAQSTSGYNSNTLLRIDSLVANSSPIWLTNGTVNTLTQTNSYPSANSNYPLNYVYIGAYSSTIVGSRNFHGNIYEILLYSRVLESEERQKVEGYLDKKWGLTVPSIIQTPLSIPGCSVWFDGADTSTITGNPTVTAWRDKSSNSWNATTLRGSAPTITKINGSNAVSFPGTSTLTVSNVTFSSVQSRAVFAVYRMNTLQASFISFFSTQASGINNQGGHNNAVDPSGSGNHFLQSLAVGGAVQGIYVNPGVNTVGTTALTCMIHSAVSTLSNVIRLNGSNYPLSGNTLASGYGSGTVTYYIGNAYNQLYILCEYIMYQQELTVFQQRQIEGYLANKWGVNLRNELPYTHLFRSRPVALIVPRTVDPLITPRFNNCFIVKYNSTGVPIWARRIGGPDGSYVGYSVTRDSSENIIVTGTYTSLTEIYGANGKSVVFKLQTKPSDNVFVVKYDSSGTPLWVRILGGSGTYRGNSITTDSSGNIILGGVYTNSSINIYAADGTTVAFTLPQTGTTGSFVVKYDSNGTPLWGRRFGFNGSDSLRSVTTDSSGNIIVTGELFSSTLNIYAADGTTVAFTLSNSGINDVFVVKYDSSGTPLWVRRLGGTSGDFGQSVTTDSSENIIVTGYYALTLNIYAADGTTVAFTLSNSGINDVFVVKYDSSGTPLWVRKMGGTGDDRGISITTDSSQNIVVAGFSTSTISVFAADGTTVAFTINAGNFIVKYNSSGTPLWTSRFGIAGQQIFSVTTDSSQNIIVTGTYGSQILFSAINGGSTVFILRLSTANDAFVAKFNSSGTFLWANRMGGTGTSDIARSVCTDSSQNVIVTGQYNSNPLSFYY